MLRLESRQTRIAVDVPARGDLDGRPADDIHTDGARELAMKLVRHLPELTGDVGGALSRHGNCVGCGESRLMKDHIRLRGASRH